MDKLKQIFPSVNREAVEEKAHLVNEVTALFQDAAEDDSDYNENPHDEYEFRCMKSNIKALSGGTLKRINGAHDLPFGYTMEIYRELQQDDVREPYIHDIIQLSGCLNEMGLGERAGAQMVSGLQRCTGITPLGEDGAYPEERYNQSVAMVKVTRKVEDLYDQGLIKRADPNKIPVKTYVTDGKNTGPLLNVDDLTKLILESSETDRERIIKIVEDRRTVDVEGIRAILNGTDSVALSDGVL